MLADVGWLLGLLFVVVSVYLSLPAGGLVVGISGSLLWIWFAGGFHDFSFAVLRL